MKLSCKILEMFYGLDEMVPEEIKIVTGYKTLFRNLDKKLKNAELARDSNKADAISAEIDLLNAECAKRCEKARQDYLDRER